MKYRLRLLAVALAVTLILLSGFFLLEFSHRRQLERGSSELMLETTLAVLESWDPAALLQHADASLLEEKSAAGIQANFRSLSRHGELRSAGVMQGQVAVPSLLEDGPARASYILSASFSRGTVRIEARLIYRGGKWRFTEYQVYSSVQAS